MCAITPSPNTTVRAIVNGYAATEEVLKDPRFLSMDRVVISGSRPDWEEHAFYTTLMGTMMFSNPPDHTKFRRLFSKVFTARRVTDLEPAINRLIDRNLDRMAEAGGSCDFMTDFAYPVPSGVVGELLGIPEQDWAWVPPRTDRINDALNMRNGDPEVLKAADQAAAELMEYYLALIARLRAEPGDDIVSAMVREMDAGEREHHMTDVEIARNLVVTYNAAFATTTPMLANGLFEILSRPELAARLVEHPELAPGYVEEILRFIPSVQFLMRIAAEDLEFGGVEIPAGKSVLVMLGAANRDPARYPDPDTFDPSRTDVHPLSFGIGPHFCLGAALARREGVLALPKVLQRFPHIKLGQPEINDSLLIPSFLRLPVQV
ncbi:cytochrome P450 [Longispora albida]|uniref:cytochrome P450 n=1 Tax=Longispora albida TaxID=203523 RepID=UPI00036C1A46|nr:cytochrome P450 [Longispora albida]